MVRSVTSLVWLAPVLIAVLLTDPMGADAWTQDRGSSPTTACYRLPVHDSAARVARPKARYETWCYRSTDSEGVATFIFNADDARVRPELSALLDADGTITHASLLNGKLSVHRVASSQFNPLPVPLTPPPQAKPLASRFGFEFESSAESVMKFFSSEIASVHDLRIQTGDITGRVLPASVPWRGFWWPYKSLRLASGADSPMAKYDRFIRARGGRSAAAIWEREEHKYEGVDWEGHCNGWAASTILRSEPKTPKRDPATGITFSVSDIKGLYAEKDDCVSAVFYGHRNNGAPGDDAKDVHPNIFHLVLVYWIGGLQRPVAIDYMPGTQVENNVVSGYAMRVEPTGPHRYTVTTTLTIHDYDKSPKAAPGPAPSYQKTYKYTLEEDEFGNLTGGTWLSENPDFFWVPLSSGLCEGTNPYVTEDGLSQILNLPAR